MLRWLSGVCKADSDCGCKAGHLKHNAVGEMVIMLAFHCFTWHKCLRNHVASGRGSIPLRRIPFWVVIYVLKLVQK
jgi:hypothetical protein